MRLRSTHRRLAIAAISLGVFAAGCHTDMWVQPHLRPQQESDFPGYSNKSASRLPVEGTVARGHQRDDTAYYTGRGDDGKYATTIPVKQAMYDLKIDNYKDFLKRGQERFTIYCTPCHGQLGDGKGMISQRGLALKRTPATYHTDRLRKMPVGHFFDVITNGYGVMFSYAARVDTPDRWAIAAYIRVLQHSQDVSVQTLTPDEVQKLDAKPLPPPTPAGGEEK